MTKTIDQIYGEMLELFTQSSGYVPHSTCDLAVRLYTAAAQIQALFLQAQWVLEQSFPQSAQGVYLEQHAALRGLTRGGAAHAEGILRFGVSTPSDMELTIGEGTVCMTEGGERFATTQSAVLAAGSLYIDVPARAVSAGASGNVAAGTICRMAAMPAGIQACTNPEAFFGGEDGESDEALRLRLLDTYKRLPNGANAAYYEQTALSFPGVAAAMAVGRPRGVGSVDVYVASDGGAPDEALLEAISEYLQQHREISVDLQVLSPAEAAVDIAVAIRAESGAAFSDVKARAEQALGAFFSGSLLGRGVKLAQLGDLLYHLEGVENYRISSPTEDVEAAATVLPILGTVTITEWEG